MPDIHLPHDRGFPETRLSDPIIVVVPDAWAADPAVRRLAEACGAPIVTSEAFEAATFSEAHVIACGHMANNAAVTRLYNARCCFVDTLFPGDGDYLLRSISDPLGYGRNAVVAGASSNAGLGDAMAQLTKIIETSDGVLGRVFASRLANGPEPPQQAELRELIGEDLITWDGGWIGSPFRSGRLRRYLWSHYLTDHEAWGQLVAAIFAGSIEPWREQRIREPQEYHDFFGLDMFIHLWDLLEDHPGYDTADRHGVVQMFTEQLRHLAGLFYLKEEINPDGLPRQNHVTFIGLNLAAGHQYLSRRYGVTEFAHVSQRVERLFAGQALGYKPNDDAGVGYAWLVPRHTLDYMLARDDYRYLEDGHVADLCRLLGITTDNLRSEVGYGDSRGFAAFEAGGWRAHLWPLVASVWYSRSPTDLWLLNWLAEGKKPDYEQAQEVWRGSVEPTSEGLMLPGVDPESPQELLGVTALTLPAAAQRWVQQNAPEGYGPDQGAHYFDKLSLRSSFSAEDEYLLLEGVGTFCHGHEDTNAILRLTWKNRAWLADGDYIRAAPKFHNSLVVQRDGVGVLEAPGEGVVIPPLAILTTQRDDDDWGLVGSEAAGYNGVDWRRNLIWRKGRYIAVVDELHCRESGEYHCRCLWRVVGDVMADVGQVRLHQDGAELFLLHADDSTREIVEDDGGPWSGYLHHAGAVHVVHQKIAARLQTGESLTFLHVFTPHQRVKIERWGPALLRITDGDETTVVGARAGAPVAMEAGDAPAAEVIVGRPTKTAAPISDSAGRTQPLWEHDLDVGTVGPIATIEPASRPGLVVGGAAGDLVWLQAQDGAQSWRVHLASDASALLAADIDGDGTSEVLVGTAASELIVLDGKTGRERWRRPLKNLNDAPAPVTTLCVADLEGKGGRSLLAGTAGWFVNVFTPEGAPKWAQWIRYHVITALEAADVDGDGRAEVIVGNTYSTPLTVHEFDGNFRWSTLEQVGAEGNATTPRRGIGLTHMRLCDLDGDGRQEIVYGTEDGWLFAVEPRRGGEVWKLNIVGQVVGLETLPTGILAASEFGDLYTLGFDGTLHTHQHVSEWIHAAVRCGDEIVLATQGGRLLKFDATGVETGFLRIRGEVRGLHCVGDVVICALENNRICAYRFN